MTQAPRLSGEREKEIRDTALGASLVRDDVQPLSHNNWRTVRELLAELDAVRAERDNERREKDVYYEETFKIAAERGTLLQENGRLKEQVSKLTVVLRMTLSRATPDPDHDWKTCNEPTCGIARRVLESLEAADQVGKEKGGVGE